MELPKKTICEICLKLTIKTLERRHMTSGVLKNLANFTAFYEFYQIVLNSTITVNLRATASALDRKAVNPHSNLVFKKTHTEVFCLNKIPAQEFFDDICNIFNSFSREDIWNTNKFDVNPLSANFTKWSNTLKQFVGKFPTNCLSVFDHFVG